MALTADRVMKTNDLRPPIRVQLGFDGEIPLDAQGSVIPLGGTAEITFRKASLDAGGNTLTVDWTAEGVLAKKAMIIEDANAWIVRHDWVAPETATEGWYVFEVEHKDAAGKPQTHPQRLVFTLELIRDLDQEG